MLHHSMYMIYTKICQYKHYKNKEHIQRHVCVSIYLCKGNSEIGIVIWQRSENIYNNTLIVYLLMGELQARRGNCKGEQMRKDILIR